MDMKITQAILDNLTAKAKESPRLRMNLDLRDSAEDTSQRMLNAIEPGSPLPIHRHQKTSETVVCLRGRLVEEFYDDLERTCTERIELSPNGPVVALNIPAGQWHTVQALESGTVILIVLRIRDLIENETRSCSMDFGGITPLYVYRMWGGTVNIEKIEQVMSNINMDDVK